jgi:hypothetical protein
MFTAGPCRCAGTGQVSVAAALTFVPRRLTEAAVYRGLYVEQIVRASGCPAWGSWGLPGTPPVCL